MFFWYQSAISVGNNTRLVRFRSTQEAWQSTSTTTTITACDILSFTHWKRGKWGCNSTGDLPPMKYDISRFFRSNKWFSQFDEMSSRRMSFIFFPLFTNFVTDEIVLLILRRTRKKNWILLYLSLDFSKTQPI